MKKQFTYRELNEFTGTAQAYLAQNTEGKEPGQAPMTKLAYALQKLIKRAKPILQNLSDKLEDARIENAAEDPETKVLLTDEKGNFRYSREGMKSMTSTQRSAFTETVEFEGHFVHPNDIPEDLPTSIRDKFIGFVIEPEPGA